MSGRVLVVGSYNQDLVWEVDALPAPGETRAGLAFRSGPGGKGFNQAVAAARAGAASTFIGALGDDTLAEGARALARAEGIDARFATVPDAATGTAGILVDAQGRNSIVVALGANERLSVPHVEAQAEAFRHAAVVLAPLESPSPPCGQRCGSAGPPAPAPSSIRHQCTATSMRRRWPTSTFSRPTRRRWPSCSRASAPGTSRRRLFAIARMRSSLPSAPDCPSARW